MGEKMKFKFSLTVAAVLMILVVVNCAGPSQEFLGKSYSNSPVHDRVVKSQVLRVGYLVLPPYLDKNTSTQELSGIFFDVVEELGRRLDLKVKWVEEVSLATLALGFETDRYDMIGFPLWRSSSRAKKVSFSEPLFYSTVGIYVRPQDAARFSDGNTSLNLESVSIATIDGELTEAIAKSDFPKAKTQALPALSDYSQLLMEVASGKADVTFYNRVFGERFIEQNPGTVVDISGERPIRVFAEAFVLPLKDGAFREMINATVLEMIENGFIEKAFRASGEDPADYFMTAVPYKIPSRRD